MKPIQAKPIETEFGTLYPSISEKLKNGKTTNSGVITGFHTHAGEATLNHKGKKRKIDISAGINGSTIIRAENGRWFVVSIEKLINHAIEAGMLDDGMKFEQAK
jgi:hypothetical protein